MTRPCLAQPQPQSPEAPGAKGSWGIGLPASPGWGHRDKPKQGALWTWQGR